MGEKWWWELDDVYRHHPWGGIILQDVYRRHPQSTGSSELTRCTTTSAFIHCVYVCYYEGMRDLFSSSSVISLQDITSNGPVQIKENLNNAIFTIFQTMDEDPGHKHTYSLVKNPDKKFRLVGSWLMTTSTANLNYEDQSTYSITIRSTDNGSPPRSVEKAFTVKVLDVNEAPASVLISRNQVWRIKQPCFTITILSILKALPIGVQNAEILCTEVGILFGWWPFKTSFQTLHLCFSEGRMVPNFFNINFLQLLWHYIISNPCGLNLS